MVDMDESQFSLMSLEEELTCSICLNTFDCPVTLPCGHNFCQSCLLSHWEDSYSCPQCRTLFPNRPELKKNTVLSTVVQTFSSKWNKTEAEEVAEESEEEKVEDVIRCDTCMEAEAAKTCLTCMANFCEDHLRPHLENPKFSVHELCEPSRDMSERLCQDHQKLIEFFCSEHNRPICSQCLQQVHRQCPFISPEEQRNHKQSDFKEKLGLLDVKIERTETVLFYMKDIQSKLRDASVTRKTALAALYQQMRDLLVSEEREAQHEVDREHEVCQTKLQDLMKRFTENSGNMKKAREDVNSLLSQSQTVAFLQASYEMPRVVNFDPHPPRVNLDSKRVTATQACAAALKEHLTELLKQPVEARLMTLKPDEIPAPITESESSASAEPKPGLQEPPRSHNPVSPPIQPIYQTVPVPVYIHSPQPHWNPPQYAHSSGPHKGPFKGGQKTGGGQSGGGKQGGGQSGGGKQGGGHPGGGKPGGGQSGGGRQGGGHPGGGKPGGGQSGGGKQGGGHPGGGKQSGGHPGGGKPGGGKPGGGHPGGGKPSGKGQPPSGKSQPHNK